jgi:hypothetical protein
MNGPVTRGRARRSPDFSAASRMGGARRPKDRIGSTSPRNADDLLGPWPSHTIHPVGNAGQRMAVALFALAGCSSPPSSSISPSDAGANLTNFTGKPWSGTATITATCLSGTSSQPTTIQFTSQGTDLTYASDGCGAVLSVSGDTATLINAPVTCAIRTTDAGTSMLTINALTFTTSDGTHLKGSASTAIFLGAESCRYMELISASR